MSTDDDDPSTGHWWPHVRRFHSCWPYALIFTCFMYFLFLVEICERWEWYISVMWCCSELVRFTLFSHVYDISVVFLHGSLCCLMITLLVYCSCIYIRLRGCWVLWGVYKTCVDTTVPYVYFTVYGSLSRDVFHYLGRRVDRGAWQVKVVAHAGLVCKHPITMLPSPD